MGKYPGESNEPMSHKAFCAIITALGAVFLISCIALVITVSNDFGSPEYTQGYNDALQGNSSTHLQIKDIEGSERVDRYEMGYAVGVKKLQKDIRKQTNNESIKCAESLLGN